MKKQETQAFDQEYMNINERLYEGFFLNYNQNLRILNELEYIKTLNPIKKLKIYFTKRQLNRGLAADVENMDWLVEEAVTRILRE